MLGSSAPGSLYTYHPLLFRARIIDRHDCSLLNTLSWIPLGYTDLADALVTAWYNSVGDNGRVNVRLVPQLVRLTPAAGSNGDSLLAAPVVKKVVLDTAAAR